MADDSISNQLTQLMKNLSLGELDAYPNCYPTLNPMDILRSHVTSLLHKASGIEPNIIYPAIQWTQGLEKGDLIIAAPALRVKGKKPDELAKELVSKVIWAAPAPQP
jgi:arginyl-tRNA synthetase